MKQEDSSQNAKSANLPNMTHKIGSPCGFKSQCTRNQALHFSKKPTNLTNFSKQILSTLLTHYIDHNKKDKEEILKNLNSMDFIHGNYFGVIQINNMETCESVWGTIDGEIIASCNYHKGRTVAIAFRNLFDLFYNPNKYCIIFLSNVINWVTHSKKNSKQTPLKLLLTTSNPKSNPSTDLDRASCFILTFYQQNLQNIDLSQYDCIVFNPSLDYMNDKVYKKLLRFVEDGGGLVMGYTGWVMKRDGKVGEFGERENQCRENYVLGPMGMIYRMEVITAIGSDFIINKNKQKQQKEIELIDNSRPYTKQQRPQFIYRPPKEPSVTSKWKTTLLQGVGDFIFKSSGFSSFIFPEDSFVSLLRENQSSFSFCGTFGKGKIFGFSHPAIFAASFVKENSHKRFVQNVIRWMTGVKDKISVGLLYQSGDWYDYGWQNLDMNVTSTFIQTPDFDNKDIICVSYYSNYPKALTPEVIQKLKDYVNNGGNLFFASHGWVWQNFGEYKNNKSLVYEKDFASYLILRSFDIKLNKDFFESQSPFTALTLNDTRNKILENAGDWSFDGVMSPFIFPQKTFTSVLKQNEKSFSVLGNYGKGKIFTFSHPGIFSKEFLSVNPQKIFVQNVIRWMTGIKAKISVGLLYQTGDWYNFGLEDIGMNITSKFIQTPADFDGLDIIFVTYYSHYPKALTPQVIEKLKQYVSNGGNLFFTSHGWVWETYGEYKENKTLKYEKDFASYVILKAFDITLTKDWLDFSNPYHTSQNIIKKDQAVSNFLKNDLLTVLKNQDKNSFESSSQQVNQILSKINGTEPSQFDLISSTQLYHTIVEAFIESRFNVEDNYDKIAFSDPFICKVFSFMNALSYSVPPHICRALPPSLNKYPGYATNRLKEKTVEVYRNRNNRIFTGLYLNPGEVIRIRHKNTSHETAGVRLKVNLNYNLSNSNNGNLKRFTHVSRTYKIKPDEFLIASPHGGIIYFEVDQDATQTKPLLFTFEGAYEGIYWNENIHSYADFQNIKKIEAPIFIFETKRMNLIGPTKGLLAQLNIPIEKLCNFWNTVVGIYKDYRGIEQYPFAKDSYFNDVNIVAGYMHAGNPVMTHDDLTLEMIGVGDKLFTDATWGFYHELGHNHQDNKWTVNQTSQVTCNIYSLLLTYKMHGKTIEQNMWQWRIPEKSLREYMDKPDKTMEDYARDPIFALALYAIIMEELGYEVFSKVHKAYDSIQLPDDRYETKFDTLMEQVSLATGKNMWYYFKKWGMPVTAASLEKVKNLEKFLCKRFPFITE